MSSSSNIVYSLYGPNHKSPPQADFCEIIEMDRELFSRPWSEPSWASCQRNFENYALIVMKCSGKLIGVSLFHLIPLEKMGHLLKILIQPEFRGKGLGKIFLEEGLNQLKSYGFKSFYLEVEDMNHRAIALYRSQGFVDLRELKNYYGSGQNAISMICHVK